MRKLSIILLVLVLLSGTIPALAQNEYHLAGYEGNSVNRDWNSSPFFERWGTLFDLSFSFSQYGEYTDWEKEIQAYLNGATLPDALFKAELNIENTLALLEKGLIVDLKPFIETDMPNLKALLNENPEWEKDITLPSGVIAALPALTKMQLNNGIWVNTKWLDNIKMEMPTDKESFENMLRAFKTGDPNKNGKRDEIPLTFLGTWDLKFLAHAYGLIANDYNIYVDEGGQVRYLTEAENFRDFVQWLRDLYTEGLIDGNGFTNTDAARQVTDEKAVVPYGMLMGTTPVNLLPAADISVYMLMEPLEFEGQKVYRDLIGQVGRGTFAVTSACENPGVLLKAIDYLYSLDGAMLATAGLEGTEYTRGEDGRWQFIIGEESDPLALVRAATIADGGNLPGYSSDEMLLSFGDESTRENTQRFKTLNEYARLPYPLVSLNSETQKAADALQETLGSLFEARLGRFILSQTELDDENWNAFLDELKANDLQAFLAIWQKALDER